MRYFLKSIHTDRKKYTQKVLSNVGTPEGKKINLSVKLLEVSRLIRNASPVLGIKSLRFATTCYQGCLEDLVMDRKRKGCSVFPGGGIRGVASFYHLWQTPRDVVTSSSWSIYQPAFDIYLEAGPISHENLSKVQVIFILATPLKLTIFFMITLHGTF